MKLVLGKWATDRVAAGTHPELAAREAIAYLYNRLGGHGWASSCSVPTAASASPTTPLPWPGASPRATGLHTGLTV